MKVSGSLIYFLPLLLYFPTLIPNNETQPLLVFVFSCLALIRNGGESKIVLLFFWLATLVAAIALSGLGNQNLLGSLVLLQLAIGPIVLFAAFSLRAKLPTKRVLIFVVMVMWLVALIEMFFPQLYESIASVLLSRFNVTDGSRGVSLLTPEPTYASISIFYVLALTISAETDSARSYLSLKIALTLLMLLTLSTYAILLIAVLLASRFVFLSAVLFGFGNVYISVVGFLEIGGDESFRFVTALNNIGSLDYGDFLASISVIDPSLGTRVASILVGLSSMFGTFFGFGLDCSAMTNAIANFGYESLYLNEVILNSSQIGCLKPHSYIAAIGLGLGSVSLLLTVMLLYLFLKLFRRGLGGSTDWGLIAAAFLMLFIQCQISNPIPWLILYLSISGHIAKDSKTRLAVKEDSLIAVAT